MNLFGFETNTKQRKWNAMSGAERARFFKKDPSAAYDFAVNYAARFGIRPSGTKAEALAGVVPARARPKAALGKVKAALKAVKKAAFGKRAAAKKHAGRGGAGSGG